MLPDIPGVDMHSVCGYSWSINLFDLWLCFVAQRMQCAAQKFVGEHDFRNFCKVGM